MSVNFYRLELKFPLSVDMCTIFLAPLFRDPNVHSEIENYRDSCIKYSKNRNSVNITFSSKAEAELAIEKFTSNFPNIDAKIIHHQHHTHLLPVSLNHPDLPHGLIIIPDFITPTDEASVVSLIDSLPWDTTIKRRVQHYGFQFKYSQLKAELNQPYIPIPEFFDQFLLHPTLSKHRFDQITINEYVPGIGIASHCDTHSAFSETIAVISLSDSIVMDFVSHEGTKVSVTIPQRSLVFMTGESRYGWRHAIACRKSDLTECGNTVTRVRRVSLTFRRVVSVSCKCEFSALCDSQGADLLRPRRMNSG